jgi:hypothetical protein
MWFRTDNGARNLENGHTFGVRERADERSQVTWEIFSTIPVPGVGATVLQDGYATKEAAEEALEGFLTAHGVEVVAIDDPNAEAPAEGTEGPAEDDTVTESDKTGETEVDEFASTPTTPTRSRKR